MSRTNYVRRETARNCTVHQAVMEKAIQYLNDEQYFSKEQVIKSLGFDAIAQGIRWDYVVEFIREGEEGDDGMELVPLKESFFKYSKRQREANPECQYPEKYIAGGHGGKTVGYASVLYKNGVFALYRHKWMSKLQNGVADAFCKYSEALAKRDVLDKPAVVRTLPAVEKRQQDMLT